MGVLDPLYAALGVAPDTGAEDVKKAFRKVARECHPDVAGDDPKKAERFRAARDAYEVLTDDAKRLAYEVNNATPRAAPPPRARKGRPEDSGAFFKAFYHRATGGKASAPTGSPAPERPKTHGQTFRARNAGQPYDTMDDLFADFGYGSESGGGGGGGPSRAQTGPSNQSARRGDDVILDLEVTPQIAREGGTVLGSYVHLAKDERWKVGDSSPGVIPRHEQVPLDIPSGSRFGSIIRFRGLGDAGPRGGPAGDLVVRLRVNEEAEPTRPPPGARTHVPHNEPPPRPSEGSRPPPGPQHDPATGEHKQVVDITVFEALLGGRIEVNTPSGRVRMAIPPCTSSGQSFRLKGRGPRLLDGIPSDLRVEVRIITPSRLDAKSQELAEELARLNPEVPER